MAVTLTVAALSQSIRLGGSGEETEQATRLLAYATEAISRHLVRPTRTRRKRFSMKRRFGWRAICTTSLRRLVGLPSPMRFAIRARRRCCWPIRIHRAGSVREEVA